LSALAGLEHPLLVAVLNNDGGRLFDHLPIHDVEGLDEEHRALWTTPHGRSFEHAARMFDAPYFQVEAGESSVPAFSAAWTQPGLSLAEVRVPCDASVRLDAQLRARLACAPREEFEGATVSSPAPGLGEGHVRRD